MFTTLRGAMLKLAWACLLVTLTAERHTAQDRTFAVIVNKANPVKLLTFPELRRIFMKQTRMWPHGESIVPVEWDATSPLRAEFSQLVFERSVREMTDFWVQQGVTQGVTPPTTHRSSRAVLRFVESVPGAIAYVPAGDADSSVSVVIVPKAR